MGRKWSYLIWLAFLASLLKAFGALFSVCLLLSKTLLKSTRCREKGSFARFPRLAAAFGTSHFIAARRSSLSAPSHWPSVAHGSLPIGRPKAREIFPPLGFLALWRPNRSWRREGPFNERNTGLSKKLEQKLTAK